MSQPDSIAKTLFKMSGYSIVLLCLGLVGVQIFRHAPALGEVLGRPDVILWLVGSSVVYAACFVILVVAWHLLLVRIFGEGTPFFYTYYIYTRTSIAKYLPGNVGHVVGRQVLGKARGLQHRAIAGASAMELVCMVCVAAVISLWVDLPMTVTIPTWVYVAASGLVLMVAPLAVIHFGRYRGTSAVEHRSFIALYRSLGQVCLLDLCFFLATGTLLYYLALGAGITLNMGFPSVVAVYSVSWFLGLVTPGAPAGAGIREAVIIAMLSGPAGQAEALAVALLFRVMTTAGDVLFFASSFLPWVNREEPQ